MNRSVCAALFIAGFLDLVGAHAARSEPPSPPLGLPPVAVPNDNPSTPAKIALGESSFSTRGSARRAR